ncbi:MAG: VOC family protein [Bacteroidia bacterium]
MNLVSGIQQVGIGVHNAEDAFKWFRQTFGINAKIFDDEAEATLMKSYTGNAVHKRRAILAYNMNGGGGTEIWQFTSRKSAESKQVVKWGDLGINAVKLKSNNVEKSHLQIKSKDKTELFDDPGKNKSFFVSDNLQNAYQVVDDNSWFKRQSYMQGGVCGAIIGVSNMDKSLAFYKDAFNLNEVVYDVTGTFDDLGKDSAGKRYRRVLLKLENDYKAAFSKLLGDIQIELIQSFDDVPHKTYDNRYWGDIGFIHLCFDVPDMQALKSKLHKSGYLFTVDSADTFDMGDSGGRFGYVEDPDGTLIEMVEIHKLPVMKKLGIYFNVKNRKRQKPLPDWMVGLLRLNKVAD